MKKLLSVLFAVAFAMSVSGLATAADNTAKAAEKAEMKVEKAEKKAETKTEKAEKAAEAKKMKAEKAAEAKKLKAKCVWVDHPGDGDQHERNTALYD